MRFHVCLGNHRQGGRDSVASLTEWLVGGLAALGHEVSVSDDSARTDALNIFFEHFCPGYSADLDSIDYAIVATEWSDGGVWNQHEHPYWVERWAGFQEVRARAKFTWALVPDTAKALGVPLLELGWLPSMERPPLPDRYDFFFHGSLTEERMTILNELGKRGHRIAMPMGFASAPDLEELIRSSKINLNLRTTTTFPIPSVGRIGKVLHCHRMVVTEWTPQAPSPSDLIPMCPQGCDFADFAEQWLDGVGHADSIVELYQQRPMAECLERILDISLG